MTDTKVCRRCNAEKAVSEFYFHRIAASGKAVYYADCRDCMVIIRAEKSEETKIKDKARYQANRPARLAARAAYRAADPEKLKEQKRLDHIKHRDQRNAKSKQWGKENPERKKELLELWHERNPTYAPAYRAEYYAENRDQILLDAKAYRDLHLPEIHAYQKQYRLDNPDKVKALNRKFWKENPGYAAAAHAKRKALKLSAEGFHTPADLRNIRRMQGDKCANPACRRDLHGKGHMDHRIALQSGGSNWPRNLQYLCEPCNCSKRARDEIEFFQSQIHEVSKPGAQQKLFQHILL